jgi:hypothetical protein
LCHETRAAEVDPGFSDLIPDLLEAKGSRFLAKKTVALL